jgi:hypothetical protein
LRQPIPPTTRRAYIGRPEKEKGDFPNALSLVVAKPLSMPEDDPKHLAPGDPP